MAVSAICKIKHEACSWEVNKAQGKVKCFIGIEAVRRGLYFMYSKSYRPCFNCFKELTHERLIKAYPL